MGSMCATTLAYGQVADSAKHCLRFRIGHFAYLEEPYTAVIVTRTDRRQYEYDPEEQSRTIFKIEWTGDCSFRLQGRRGRIKGKRIKKFKRTIIDVRIIEFIGEHKYRYEAFKGGERYVFSMEKIL